MKLLECMTSTTVARPGMTVGEALATCVACNCPGLPYLNEKDELVGRFSVRHVFYQHCIPADLIKHAHLLGNDIENIEMEDQFTSDFLRMPVTDFILCQVLHLNPNSQLVKALALMEQFNTSYLFVVDDNERYLGVVTQLSIARLLLQDSAK